MYASMMRRLSLFDNPSWAVTQRKESMGSKSEEDGKFDEDRFDVDASGDLHTAIIYGTQIPWRSRRR